VVAEQQVHVDGALVDRGHDAPDGGKARVRDARVEVRDHARAQAVEAGRPVELQVDGQVMRLEPTEVLVEMSSPPGYAVAEDGGLLVALSRRD
jgi:hypothetical protein